MANARSWQAQDPNCSFTLQGVTYQITNTYDYRVWYREQLIKHFNALPKDARSAVAETLKEFGP